MNHRQKTWLRYDLTYSSWAHMIQRCKNPKNKNYKWYGGRGIKVCERWRNSFKNFLKDMGTRPKGLTLDRINNNDNYKPENCRWTTIKQQNNNSRPKSCGRSKQRWFYGHGPNGEMIIENSQCYVARIFELKSEGISACLSKRQKQHRSWKFELLKKDQLCQKLQ